MDKIVFDWGFESSPSVEYEKMKAELERDRANILNESRSFAEIVSQMINAPNHTVFTWDSVNGHQVQQPQSVQNLHPKKVNWQEEGF